jgi:putative glutamine amidotransferase
MTRPRIGIPIPTFAQTQYNERTWPQYAAAVAQAGGDPIEIPLALDPAQVVRLATSCQAILLPGCPADVNPAKYGEERLPETTEPDLHRENVDELLLQDAHNLHKPLLTICYGTQSLNCWRTGTLMQDLVQIPVNHRAGASVAVAHSVLIEPGSQLAQIVRDSPEVIHSPDFLRLSVNSSHHQAIGIVGDGLRVTARCPQDAVVESIEGTRPGHFVLGLQWHPERSIETSPASRLLFRRFVEAAVAWEPRSVSVSLG